MLGYIHVLNLESNGDTGMNIPKAMGVGVVGLSL
jgi:hypothetical protein